MTGETRLGAYCRKIEAALHAAAGAPARITGPDFAVVLEWIRDDVPLSAVERAIGETAKRQRGRGQPVRIRVAYLDRDARGIEAGRRRRVGPVRGLTSARIRNCPQALGGCGALDRGTDEQRCVHCGWREAKP